MRSTRDAFAVIGVALFALAAVWWVLGGVVRSPNAQGVYVMFTRTQIELIAVFALAGIASAFVRAYRRNR